MLLGGQGYGCRDYRYEGDFYVHRNHIIIIEKKIQISIISGMISNTLSRMQSKDERTQCYKQSLGLIVLFSLFFFFFFFVAVGVL